MRKLICGWCAVVALFSLTGCGDDSDDANPAEFTLSVVPTEITDSVPRQRCVFLVTLTSAGGAAAGAVSITGAAPGADVTVEHEVLLPGEVAEVTVIPRPLLIAALQTGDTGRDITVTITGVRRGLTRALTENVHVTSEEAYDLSEEAAEMVAPFIPWLTSEHPELGIDAETDWTGTVVTPHILIVSHYLYFSDEWEIHLHWHVMIPPYDWTKIELRRRFEETRYSLGYMLPSRSAEPLDFEEMAASDFSSELWR